MGQQRTMQEAAPVVGGDLQQEGVQLRSLALRREAPEVRLGVQVGADGLQAALEQVPVLGHAHADFDFEDHEAPAPVRADVACGA